MRLCARPDVLQKWDLVAAYNRSDPNGTPGQWEPATIVKVIQVDAKSVQYKVVFHGHLEEPFLRQSNEVQLFTDRKGITLVTTKGMNTIKPGGWDSISMRNFSVAVELFEKLNAFVGIEFYEKKTHIYHTMTAAKIELIDHQYQLRLYLEHTIPGPPGKEIEVITHKGDVSVVNQINSLDMMHDDFGGIATKDGKWVMTLKFMNAEEAEMNTLITQALAWISDQE